MTIASAGIVSRRVRRFLTRLLFDSLRARLILELSENSLVTVNPGRRIAALVGEDTTSSCSEYV